MVLLLTGFLAGAVHVLSGPDHLAAVAPLALDSRRIWAAGLLWGVGHVVGVAILGGFVLLLRGAVPLDSLAARSEQVVGVTLIGIGAWALQRTVRRRIHVHEHEHGGARHTHLHAHVVGHGREPSPHRHTHASFGVGMLHGLAGTAHVVALVPALGLPGTVAAAVYLAGYGAGTIASMAGFTWLLGLLAGSRVVTAGNYRWFAGSTAVSAILVGVFWLAA